MTRPSSRGMSSTPAFEIVSERSSSPDSDGSGWFSVMRRVGWTEVDPSSNYQFTDALRYVEEAEIALLREAGVLNELYPHIPRTHVSANYVYPARFDDLVTVQVKLARIGRSSIELDFRILLGEVMCAYGSLGSAFIDPATGGSVAVPASIRLKLGQPAGA